MSSQGLIQSVDDILNSNMFLKDLNKANNLKNELHEVLSYVDRIPQIQADLYTSINRNENNFCEIKQKIISYLRNLNNLNEQFINDLY